MSPAPSPAPVRSSKPPTVRGQLEQIIDTALGHGCKDFDSFLAAMRVAGVEVKRGKHLAFKIPNGKRFVRCDSLGADYSEAAIMECISSKRIVALRQKQSAPNLLIDIQAKLQQTHAPGFERWASVFNLKEMAKTMNFLQEHGLRWLKRSGASAPLLTGVWGRSATNKHAPGIYRRSACRYSKQHFYNLSDP